MSHKTSQTRKIPFNCNFSPPRPVHYALYDPVKSAWSPIDFKTSAVDRADHCNLCSSHVHHVSSDPRQCADPGIAGQHHPSGLFNLPPLGYITLKSLHFYTFFNRGYPAVQGTTYNVLAQGIYEVHGTRCYYR